MKMEWKNLLCVERTSDKPHKKYAPDLRSEFEKDYNLSLYNG